MSKRERIIIHGGNGTTESGWWWLAFLPGRTITHDKPYRRAIDAVRSAIRYGPRGFVVEGWEWLSKTGFSIPVHGAHKLEHYRGYKLRRTPGKARTK